MRVCTVEVNIKTFMHILAFGEVVCILVESFFTNLAAVVPFAGFDILIDRRVIVLIERCDHRLRKVFRADTIYIIDSTNLIS